MANNRQCISQFSLTSYEHYRIWSRSSAVLTNGRAPRLRVSLDPSTSPPLKGCICPCFWWAPALSGPLGFILVNLMDIATLSSLGFSVTVVSLLDTLARDGRKEGNVLFNNALNTFYLRLYGVRPRIKIAREETRCRHIGYSFRLTARVLLYAPQTI